MQAHFLACWHAQTRASVSSGQKEGHGNFSLLSCDSVLIRSAVFFQTALCCFGREAREEDPENALLKAGSDLDVCVDVHQQIVKQI